MDQQLKNNKKLILFTIQSILLTAFGLLFVFKIQRVIFLWFLAFILMTALNPIVEFIAKGKLSRGFGVFVAMLLVIGGMALFLAGIIPPLIKETNAFIAYINRNLDYLQYFQIDRNIINQMEMITRGALNVVKIISSTFSNVFGVISLVVLTVYMLIERPQLKHALKHVFRGQDTESKAETFLESVERRLGGWVRAEAFLMFIIGIFTYIGLLIMQVPFALPLALLAGLLELIPNIGPIVASIPAIAAGLSISPTTGVAVAILYIVIQQAENHLLVPFVMKQSVGLNPLITLFCLMAGATLGGITGAILGVPIFITLLVIIRTINRENKLHIPLPETEE